MSWILARIEITKLVKRLFLTIDKVHSPLLIKSHISSLLIDFLAHTLPRIIWHSLLIVVIHMLLHLLESLFPLKVIILNEVCAIAFQMLLLFLLDSFELSPIIGRNFITVQVYVAVFVGSRLYGLVGHIQFVFIIYFRHKLFLRHYLEEFRLIMINFLSLFNLIFHFLIWRSVMVRQIISHKIWVFLNIILQRSFLSEKWVCLSATQRRNRCTFSLRSALWRFT